MFKTLFTLTIFMFVPFLSFTQVNLNQGLAAYYPFNGNANDISGNNNNPNFNNATLTNDRFGNSNNAYHFNGQDNYIRIPNNSTLNFNNTMSVACWVRVTGFYQGPCHGNRILMKGDADYLPGNYTLTFDDNAYTYGQNCSNPIPDELHQNFYGLGSIQSPGYTPYVQLNQWVSVIYTNDGVTGKLYINCELKSAAPSGGLTFTNSFDLFLGRLNDSQYPYWFNGDLDEVRVYNRALNIDEVNELGGCARSGCNNWLNTPFNSSSVNLGDLDVSGDQITVEATINRTTPYINGNLYAGDVVAKHMNPTDVNYLLRPNSAEITTTNGYFVTPNICAIELNKTYHIAMVYNGTELKFYRNGYLMSKVNATGNLFQNNFNTRIGYYAAELFNTQFVGYINEVRIWNVARSQAEIRSFMNNPIPNPSTQTGLLGYYTFDNLINKQGNAAFNGSLQGGATINATNPNCNFIIDSCNIIRNTGPVVINNYTPVLAFDKCKNIITVEDGTKYNIGDTVLMIQMKGAIIDSSNTATFGTITNYNNAGNYEFNYVKRKVGNNIELKNILTRNYDVPNGKVQLIRVPYFENYTANETLTCLPWDGNKGGVLVLNVENNIELNADIDVSGKGFRGGHDPISNPSSLYCEEDNYYYNPNPDLASEKGEGIALLSSEKSFGKGAYASGGGSGNSHNSGGGGGGNGAIGGRGGYNFEGAPCMNSPFMNNGIGGNELNYNNLDNKIFLGGGAGAGHSNNPEGFESNGGNGGAIILIHGVNLKCNNSKIVSTGFIGKECNESSSGCHEGMGGGGAGGTILLDIDNYLDNAVINAAGGDGANMNASGYLRLGPGGGGAGGVIWLKQNSAPSNFISQIDGGINGVCTSYANDPWGATAGENGKILYDLNLPVSSTPFQANIDSVRFTFETTDCKTVSFEAIGYTNVSPVQNWTWTFGNAGTGTMPNEQFIFPNEDEYMITLVGTDIYGCKDSIVKPIYIEDAYVDARPDEVFCYNENGNYSIVLDTYGYDGSTYSWTPTALLNDATLQSPTATFSGTATFYVTNTLGKCTAKDSTKVTILPQVTTNIISSLGSTILLGETSTLYTTGIFNTYQWYINGNLMQDSTNPSIIANTSAVYELEVTDDNGCIGRARFPLVVLNNNDISLTGNNAGTHNVLRWNVINNNIIDIILEKSYDGYTFNELHKTSRNNLTSYFDYAIQPNKRTYYRVKWLKYNGQHQYSNVIVLDNAKDGDIVKLFPNPANNIINVISNNIISYSEIISMHGQVLLRTNKMQNSYDISSLPSGSYVCRLFVNNKWIIIPFIKN